MIFLDKAQKTSPLNCVTVIVIYAKQVEETLRNSLFDVVCKNGGDGFDTAILPCVVDLENQICTFDSMRIPYTGFQYPVKNRGIRIIRKYLFNNKFPLADSPDTLDPIKDLDPEQSLWLFWKTMKKELVSDDKEMKKRFGIGDTIPEIREEDIPKLAHYADKEANPLYPVPVLMDAEELEKFYYMLLDNEKADDGQDTPEADGSAKEQEENDDRN